ncbi:MAG: protein kinase domain-containing protein, partial [Sciscionella sp.]
MGAGGERPGSWATEPVYRPLGERDPRRIGEFELLGVLGTGGMGTVYLGATRHGYVAVKRVLPALAGSKQFDREIRALYAVLDGVAPRVRASDYTAQHPWFATDYVPGCTLAEVVKRCGALPGGTLWRLMRVLAGHMHQVHQAGITHRDLTPNNVMLTAGGARLIDFGIARLADQINSTRTGGSAGTRGFMAPEQLRGGEVAAKADVYALGALLCYAASGSWPRGTPDLAPLRDIDSELADVVEPCLAEDPDARPDAAELAEVARSQTSDTDTSWPAAVMERIAVLTAFAASVALPRSRRRWRTAVLAGSAALVVLGVGAFTTEVLSGQARTSGTHDSSTRRSVLPSPVMTLRPSPTPPATIVTSASPSMVVKTRATTVSPTPATTTLTPSATPTVDPHGYFYIENSGTGSCLSFDYVSPAAGPGQCGSGATTDGW